MLYLEEKKGIIQIRIQIGSFRHALHRHEYASYDKLGNVWLERI